MNEREAFECSESIARGDHCLSCGAVWVDHELIHADDCEYSHYPDSPAACDDCRDGQPCYSHDAGYRAFCDEQEAIHEGRATQLVHCYLCEPDVNKRLDKDAGPLRGVQRHTEGRTHPTHPEADVYDVLHLIPCGHAII